MKNNIGHRVQVRVHKKGILEIKPPHYTPRSAIRSMIDSFINGDEKWRSFQNETTTDEQKKYCDICGNLRKNFIHGCSENPEMFEIFGCKRCDDTCGWCG